MTTSEQQAVPVAQLQTLQDWLREPDHAEHFGTSQLVEWINRRPTHIVPAVLASLTSHPCKSGEGAGEGREDTDFVWVVPRHATDEMMNAGLYHCSADMTWADLFTAFHYMVDEAQQDDRILALTPDATQTREAELVAACEAYVEAYDAGTGTIHVNKQIRAALNARGGA